MLSLLGISLVLLINFDGFKQKLEVTQPGLYKVSQFSDGDTINVLMNGQSETVRMIGVDTPETHHPDRPLECYGQEATNFTKEIIGSQEVRLEADPENSNRDRYGRLLRYVYLPDGSSVSARLIDSGFGFAYTFFPFEKSTEFEALEAKAKSAKRGLWAACEVIIESNGSSHTAPAS